MTPAYGSNVAYIRSVSNAGAITVLIPSNLANEDLDNLLTNLDGILFTGGSDLDPACYGSALYSKVQEIDTERDRVELYLVRKAVQLQLPFFGICRGCQVINVALGGSLYEDLADQFPGDIQHDKHDKPRNSLVHPVVMKATSRLNEILEESSIEVNSLHHQGINQLASKLTAVAHAPDGLVEAVELPAHPFGLAVQWHPEELQAYEPMRKLFGAFIQACQVGKTNEINGNIQ
jgi:putative glutamine amidotransferase